MPLHTLLNTDGHDMRGLYYWALIGISKQAAGLALPSTPPPAHLFAPPLWPASPHIRLPLTLTPLPATNR